MAWPSFIAAWARVWALAFIVSGSPPSTACFASSIAVWISVFTDASTLSPCSESWRSVVWMRLSALFFASAAGRRVLPPRPQRARAGGAAVALGGGGEALGVVLRLGRGAPLLVLFGEALRFLHHPLDVAVV